MGKGPTTLASRRLVVRICALGHSGDSSEMRPQPFELAGPEERTRIHESLFPVRELGLHELYIESDGDLVADQNATSLECSVPGQAEVLAVDLCARRNRNSGVAPGILRRWRWPFNRKADFARHAPDSQVAFHQQFSLAREVDARRLEVQGRE